MFLVVLPVVACSLLVLHLLVVADHLDVRLLVLALVIGAVLSAGMLSGSLSPDLMAAVVPQLHVLVAREKSPQRMHPLLSRISNALWHSSKMMFRLRAIKPSFVSEKVCKAALLLGLDSAPACTALFLTL